MISVYQVTHNTRMHLPSSRWAQDVLVKLSQMGYHPHDLGPAPEHDTRSNEEKERVKEILDSTGL